MHLLIGRATEEGQLLGTVEQQLAPAPIPCPIGGLSDRRNAQLEIVGEVHERLEMPAHVGLLALDIDQQVTRRAPGEWPIVGLEALVREEVLQVERAVPLEPAHRSAMARAEVDPGECLREQEILLGAGEGVSGVAGEGGEEVERLGMVERPETRL